MPGVLCVPSATSDRVLIASQAASDPAPKLHLFTCFLRLLLVLTATD